MNYMSTQTTNSRGFDPVSLAHLAAVLDASTAFEPNLLHTTVSRESERRARLAVERAVALLEEAGKRGAR